MNEFLEHNNLTVAEKGSLIYLCINGRGSFRNSPSLKDFIIKNLKKNLLQKFFLDMNLCSGMDSTFMGVLAGLSILCKK